MISRELAIALRDAGLTWRPDSGDRFQLDLPNDVELGRFSSYNGKPEGRPQDVFARSPEKLRSHFVGKTHDALAVDDDQRIRIALDDIAETRLGEREVVPERVALRA